jgi:HEAT repeat protein
MSVRYAPLLIFFLLASWAPGAKMERPAYDAEEARAMLELLETGGEDERIRAARWLGLHQVEEAREALQRLRLGLDGAGESEDLRRVVGTSYELIDRPRRLRFRSEAEVREHLDSPEAADRADALRHLAYFGLEEELPRALAALEDPDPAVRAEAIKALGYFEREAYADRVVLLLEDEELLVRHTALAYFQTLPNAGTVARVVPLIGGSDEGLGLTAVRILEGWRLPGPVGREILEVLDLAESTTARAALLAALAELVPASLRPPDWEATLAPLMQDPDEDVRLQAALLLAPEGTGGATRVLEDLLASETPGVRRGAAEGLSRSGYRPSDRTVAALLADEDLQVRRTGLEMATGLPPARALPLFRAVLLDREAGRDLQSQALFYLPEIGGPEEVELLLGLGRAQDDDFLLVGTLGALGRLEEKLGTRQALGWYRELLATDGRTGVVYAAVAGAVRIAGDDSLMEPLAARLRLCPDEDAHQAGELALTLSVLLGRRLHGAEFASMP